MDLYAQIVKAARELDALLDRAYDELPEQRAWLSDTDTYVGYIAAHLDSLIEWAEAGTEGEGQ